MKYERGSRLAERIKERVAQVVLFELHDPPIGFVTVTRAKMSKDMSRVEIFYSVLGTEGDRSRVEHALQDARGYVQHEIAKICETRSVPHLEFVFDRSVEGAFKMEQLLDGLKKERDEARAKCAAKGDCDPYVLHEWGAALMFDEWDTQKEKIIPDPELRRQLDKRAKEMKQRLRAQLGG